jgi:arginyl-tRNA synthetase
MVVDDLLTKKIASTHEGAVLIYESTLSDLQKKTTPEGGVNLRQKPLSAQSKVEKEKSSTAHSALMIRKSDGAYLYGTTDIAAIYHRFA